MEAPLEAATGWARSVGHWSHGLVHSAHTVHEHHLQTILPAHWTVHLLVTSPTLSANLEGISETLAVSSVKLEGNSGKHKETHHNWSTQVKNRAEI